MTPFLRCVISRRSVVLTQISRWSPQFPARPAQKKRCIRVIIYVQEHTFQVVVLNWFSWNSHVWYRSTHRRILLFLETVGPIEPPIWGKICSQNQFFSFHSAPMEFFVKKIYKQYLVPPFPKEKVQHIFVVQRLLYFKNGHAPQKLFFMVILKNMVSFFFFFFFLKKLFNEKYFKPRFLQKRLYWFLSLDAPFPSKQPCPPTNDFSQFFQKMMRF